MKSKRSCPHCRVAMEHFETPQHELVELCPRCNRIWFDEGELAKVLHTRHDLPYEIKTTADPDVGYRSSGVMCPCSGMFRGVSYHPDAAVLLERCGKCRSILVDMRSLGALHDIARQTP